MRTRSQSRRHRQQQVPQTSVESPNLEKPNNNQESPVVTMADNRTMAELLQAPTEGYEDAIVVPAITADNFELKHSLLTLVQNKQFFGHDKEDPHAHIRYFNKITSTMRFPNVPNTSIKLMLFPFSLEGAARIWLEKEPPRSILTWDDLVSKFINEFFPPSKTTNLRNEITNFQQRFDESFNSLNSAAGGNFLDKRPRDCLCIIESKSKVRHSRSKAVVSKVSTSTSTPEISSDVAELKDMVKALLLDKKNQNQPSAPAPVKAVEQSCVTCGGAHSYRNCPATDGNNYRDNIQEYISQAAAANFNQGSASYRPQMVANQIRPPGFPPVQNHQNNQNRGINFNQNRGNNFNQNRGNNFNQGQIYQPQINQPPTFQAPPYQAPAPAPPAPGVSKSDFDNYVKANDAVMQNMQNQMANITDLITKFVNSNTASTSGSGSLPSNTIANPKGDVKAITTRSGVSYNGPQISSREVLSSLEEDFAVLENMDSYCNKGMGDIIVGRPFCREACIKARQFDEMITIYNGNDSVTCQMTQSHPMFKHLTNAQCSKMRPLMKVSAHDELKGISHPYQKLKGFYKGVLNLGPEYIKNKKVEEWLIRGHVSVHEM
ncbi:reverse transcriptase domain-containing protein [Tanacetum coccineum]